MRPDERDGLLADEHAEEAKKSDRRSGSQIRRA
jgi:hypothetical protein